MDPGSSILHPGSRILNPGSWILDSASRILDGVSRIQDPGSRDPGIQPPIPGIEMHPNSRDRLVYPGKLSIWGRDRVSGSEYDQPGRLGSKASPRRIIQITTHKCTPEKTIQTSVVQRFLVTTEIVQSLLSPNAERLGAPGFINTCGTERKGARKLQPDNVPRKMRAADLQLHNC